MIVEPITESRSKKHDRHFFGLFRYFDRRWLSRSWGKSTFIAEITALEHFSLLFPKRQHMLSNGFDFSAL
ncbi:hypothetical protein SCFA_1270010 [anaerobic digester metagenome]|uniref:Uncharacterized protein n=1 Tax=anaerobic digester metagenome TaxID=1263854 RepID=A0A485LWK2_9ZZZZ